ncbi:type III glutamate--ammonia ligase [Rhodopila sp.]|uniref:type III glutamate--ammonia ligase n=1 Tax=Rhodopila sp. TaxID=2480087 RepID=UPI003D0D2FDE
MTELSGIARERGIRNFLIAYTDLFGVLRAKLVPARAIDGMARDGAGFAGFATWLDMTPADPDMLALPDPTTLIQLPWKPEVGWMAADLWMSGAPVEQAPRNVLRRLIVKAAEQGLEMRTGVEPEFFLIQPSGQAIADAADRQPKPCYDQLTLMRRYDVITEICDAMEALGWEPYQNDHEDANGQYEMNWAYASALVTADRHVFFKYMVRTIAERHGLRATFMPKPFADLTGSGCHVHVSLWKNGENIFLGDSELGLSAAAHQFLGGVMSHAEALCALTNPTVNSYKRLNAPLTVSGATWSPNAVSWGGNNRTHMIRVPAPGRLEYRLADGAANPYLLQAALLAAGLDGLAKARDPGPPLDLNMSAAKPHAAGSRPLPLNLLDALRAFEASALLRDALGPSFAAAYIGLKRQAWESYMRHLTQWELDTTLDC